jgi:TRAP-type C4-dicarboxylate transport system permease small subunit
VRLVVSALTALSRSLAILAGFATFFIMVLIAADVVLRFLGSGVPGTLDIVTYYLMVIVAFLALSQVEQNDGMISVDVLFVPLSPTGKRLLMAFACAMTTLVFAGLTYASFIEAVKQFRSGSYVVNLAYVLPIWPSYFIVPLAFGVATLVAALRCGLALAGNASSVETRKAMRLSELVFDTPSRQAGESGDAK